MVTYLQYFARIIKKLHVIPFHTQLKNYAFSCGILNGHFVVSGMSSLLTAGNSYTETDNGDERQRNLYLTK